MKRCSKCEIAKVLEEFHRDRARKDGRASICRACRSADNRSSAGRARLAAWKAENADRVRELNRRAINRRDPEVERERFRKRFANNREEVLAYQREWRAKNREADKATKRRWLENNPERARVSRRRQNDMRRGGVLTPAGEEYATVLLRDPCSYCGKTSQEVDHIVAVRDGGTGDWDNLTAVCGPCNRRKNATPMLTFMWRRSTDFSPHGRSVKAA